MNTVYSNATAYLRTTRDFPVDTLPKLGIALNKSYLDIANAVNSRTIGLFTVNKQAVTGDVYFVSKNQKQQALRQVFIVPRIDAGDPPFSIPFTVSTLTQFSRIYGTCITDMPDNRPLPYSSVTANANIELNVTDTNIVITVGGSSPNLLSGIVILEWLSQP